MEIKEVVSDERGEVYWSVIVMLLTIVVVAVYRYYSGAVDVNWIGSETPAMAAPMEEIADVQWQDKLFRDDTCAFLLIETADGERIFEPIAVGDGGIVEVVKRMSELHPNCRARLFSRDQDRNCFKDFIPPERVF